LFFLFSEDASMRRYPAFSSFTSDECRVCLENDHVAHIVAGVRGLPASERMCNTHMSLSASPKLTANP
jgi:hypothetical protein